MIQGLQRAMLNAYDNYKRATEDIEKNKDPSVGDTAEQS